ncbi:trifunctional UDP-glucose 4 6-dehydratase/UDP-4-keto-6-deoxy-D-glucose 3 5-epimerase/UDP-4-keto-L-rhamnose-reductase RHM1 [Prunus yedoensis var. nudiflora]|uniref:Trifunctional UDP-glucose 4 6-dehydratase/UDP-4-keto-6-deoxy-D-glucose 3 5-epimerase/UDP-4-keto-L-rhamnose-reductase RHM1 n=1 Tax=Prunus yedoensis var. nudiflora TaxID=2094558 RepID=A0A314V0U6_PRUYE|nr:trifunctional UDP-glucose 4 6-dehydratase/UDP-4-keto-6-deoxy-D-glucose 3 5-epimerase/UDP-4-keto-L-rhamnose-reductase RHM1 [Prunus yedoensis var. nudiflora]
MDWYVKNPEWWGDVSGALLPHPKMLMVPGIERKFDGTDTGASASLCSASDSRESHMVVPPPKNNPSTQKPSLKFLIYGKTGWIGGLLGKICEKQGSVKPTHVFNAAGVTGRPNVDWCESHKPETIRTNVVGTLTLADVCRDHNLLRSIMRLVASSSMMLPIHQDQELGSKRKTHQFHWLILFQNQGHGIFLNYPY